MALTRPSACIQHVSPSVRLPSRGRNDVNMPISRNQHDGERNSCHDIERYYIFCLFFLENSANELFLRKQQPRNRDFYVKSGCGTWRRSWTGGPIGERRALRRPGGLVAARRRIAAPGSPGVAPAGQAHRGARAARLTRAATSPQLPAGTRPSALRPSWSRAPRRPPAAL